MEGATDAHPFKVNRRDELALWVRDDVSGITKERIRLFWHGMASYYHMRMLDLFEAKQDAIVANTYWADWDVRIREARITRWSRDWSEPANLGECLWGMGKRWIGHHDYISIRNRVGRNVEHVKLAKMDGLVFASTRMCRRTDKGYNSAKRPKLLGKVSASPSETKFLAQYPGGQPVGHHHAQPGCREQTSELKEVLTEPECQCQSVLRQPLSRSCKPSC